MPWRLFSNAHCTYPPAQLADLRQECDLLRAAAEDGAGDRTSALQAELDAKRRECDQLSAMCAELMGSVELKLAGK
jgi:hypothetical protein